MRHWGFLVFLFLLISSSSSFAMTCVDNNFDKCEALGYTESTCKYGGVACPFDVNKLHCADWTCEDGRYSATSDNTIGKICAAVSYKGLNCFECACHAPISCSWETGNAGQATLTDICCNGLYQTCTSTCAPAVTVPANATATATCTGCGTTVTTAWKCNAGYTQSGNSCLAACTAGYASELISLVSSGNCSTITMTNNIVLPFNVSLNLASNTTIDGQNYGLSIRGTTANYTPIVLNGGGLKNLQILHTQDTVKSGVYIISNNASGATIQNVTINISSRLTSGWSMVFNNSGSMTIGGNLTITSNGGYAFGGFGGGGTYNFAEQSVANVIIAGQEGYIFDKGTFNHKRYSSFTGKTTGFKGLATANSIINVESGGNLALTTTGSTAYGLWNTTVDVNGGSFSLSTGSSMMGYPTGTITFAGGTLNLSTNSPGTVNIVTRNTNGRVTYNGTNYKPVRAATTSLSSLPSSTNFIVY